MSYNIPVCLHRTVRVRLRCGYLSEDHTEWEVYGLANIKSAKKRILVAETRAARNKAIRSKVKTMTKKVEAAVAAKDKEAAKAALIAATATIESAATKGVYHKNNSARKVSRLAKLVNSMA